MTRRDPTTWMWQEACDLLEEAERLHRRFFRLCGSHAAPVWEPPADVFENDEEFVVIVALPGVPAESVQVAVDSGALVIRAQRGGPLPEHAGSIRRLEIPYGSFERSIPLPAGLLQAVGRDLIDGCLVLRLKKLN